MIIFGPKISELNFNPDKKTREAILSALKHLEEEEKKNTNWFKGLLNKWLKIG